VENKRKRYSETSALGWFYQVKYTRTVTFENFCKGGHVKGEGEIFFFVFFLNFFAKENTPGQ
jgi:hypothetical protein